MSADIAKTALTSDPYDSSKGAVFLNGEYISNQIIANSHNSLFRGEDLISSNHFGSIANLHTAISAGDFSDIFIGDYVTTKDPSNTSNTVKWLVAGINVFPAWVTTGSVSATTKNHLALVPETCFSSTMKMNSSSTTSGGYSGSSGKSTVSSYGSTLNGYFNSNLINAYYYVSYTVDTSHVSAASTLTGISSGRKSISTYAILMSEINVFGSQIWSGSNDNTSLNFQLPLFKLRPDLICIGQLYWLSGVASSSYFCVVNDGGRADCRYANDSYSVRPLILLS